MNTDEKCMFVAPLNGVCKSYINTKNKYCDEIPIEKCYYKQLQQLKQENEELKDLLQQLSADKHQKLLLELYNNRQKLERIKEYINDYGVMADDADCGLPVGILQIIKEE